MHITINHNLDGKHRAFHIVRQPKQIRLIGFWHTLNHKDTNTINLFTVKPKMQKCKNAQMQKCTCTTRMKSLYSLETGSTMPFDS